MRNYERLLRFGSGPPKADNDMGKRAQPVMSLRGVQRRSNLLVLVDTERDGEIAAASLGWPRNDMGKRAQPGVSLRGVLQQKDDEAISA